MAKPGRGPSMHDVAARAGVSHQTVSRVLNDFPGIRPETRQRVLLAIEELGYRRNVAARSLATGRSQTVGVIIPNTTDYGPVSSFYAVEAAVREAGLQALVAATADSPEAVEEALDFLMARSIEALVLMAPTRMVVDVVDAIKPPVPIAYLLTGDERAPWSASVNQRQGVRLMLDHLVGLGHTRIQHIRGPESSIEAELRAEEFGAQMRARGLAELPILRGDWSAQSGFEACDEVDPSATAVFCGNDQMAIGLIHAAVKKGMRVPEDITIVGFDDIPEAVHTLPPLTTVRQDFGEVARLAVRALVAALEGGDMPDTSPLPPELVVRESTAPAPAATRV